jgi:hypothetical protein
MPYPDADHVSNVCMVTTINECRHLSSCGSEIGWSCEKKSPLKKCIDARVESGQQAEHCINCKGLDWR